MATAKRSEIFQELTDLKELLDNGVITKQEFTSRKRVLLNLSTNDYTKKTLDKDKVSVKCPYCLVNQVVSGPGEYVCYNCKKEFIYKGSTDSYIVNKEQDNASNINNYAINLIVNEGVSVTDTEKRLISEGLDKKLAKTVVENAVNQIKENVSKAKAQRDIKFGLLWFLGGGLITVITYSMASNGESYLVAWGAIFFGFVQLVKGLINYSK